MSIDLLVFGPHPDDLEIGLGGTIARHTAEGHLVGLCDLTEGEMSSNGTVAERREEAAAAARVLGAAWRENLRWPDGDIAPTPDIVRSAVDLIRRTSAPDRDSLLDDRHPDHVAASHVLRLAATKAACGATRPTRIVVAGWICYYSSTTAWRRRLSWTCPQYERKREALACHRTNSNGRGRRRRHPPEACRRSGNDREPRRQFGALAGVAYAEGIVVREPVQRAGVLKHER